MTRNSAAEAADRERSDGRRFVAQCSSSVTGDLDLVDESDTQHTITIKSASDEGEKGSRIAHGRGGGTPSQRISARQSNTMAR